MSISAPPALPRASAAGLDRPGPDRLEPLGPVPVTACPSVNPQRCPGHRLRDWIERVLARWNRPSPRGTRNYCQRTRSEELFGFPVIPFWERPHRASFAMRALRIACLAAIAAFASPAHAVMLGTVARDPNGTRSSVVRIESSMGELCSGALIAPDLVLTAAHCLTDLATYRVVGVDRAFRPRNVRAIAAAVHPEFMPGTTPRTQPGVDLAILKLARPLGPDFAPLDPRDSDRVGTGDTVRLAGFGIVAEGQKRTARVLRETSLVSLGPLQVMNRVVVVADRHRLAETTGAGACRGDSGGPILAETRSGYQLLGIVSWSSGAAHSRELTACGGLTAVTPVADNLRWIVEGASALNAFTTGFEAPARRGEGDWMTRRHR